MEDLEDLLKRLKQSGLPFQPDLSRYHRLMGEHYARNPNNCEGPFYVVKDECMACGAPELAAGDLMSHDDSSQCFFARQPSTQNEVDAAIRAVWASCCGAVRYGGSDSTILTRFANLGELSRCDARPAPEPPIILRDRARFEFRNPDGYGSGRSELKQIIQFVASSLSNQYTRSSNFRIWWSMASFRHHWGGSTFRNSIRFHVRREGTTRWQLSMSENECARTGMAIAIDNSLRSSPLFQEIRWFSEDELSCPNVVGKEHPY
jgi:hypothetical protein